MGIKYKFNVMLKLKEEGYTTKVLQEEYGISESTMKNLRYGDPVSLKTIERICKLLKIQPGDLLEVTYD